LSDQVHVDRWHRAYAAGRRWGDEPGELARLAVVWLRELGIGPSWRLLDVGCGYGRDAVFLAREAGLRVVGIDPAAAGIELARAAAPPDLTAAGPVVVQADPGADPVDTLADPIDTQVDTHADPVDTHASPVDAHVRPDVAGLPAAIYPAASGQDRPAIAAPGPRLEYRQCGIEEVTDGPYDVVFVSNVYHVLPVAVRDALRARAFALLRPGGMLLLSTLAIGDPEHWGVTACGEPSPHALDAHLYFSTEQSVRSEFSAFEMLRLVRHEFDEPQTGGPDHHHVHWVLMARRPAAP